MDISKDQAWKKHVVCLKRSYSIYFWMIIIQCLTKVNGIYIYIKLVSGQMDMECV